MKCNKHPEVEMEVKFGGGFGFRREFICPECEKEKMDSVMAKLGQNTFSAGKAGWQ